MRLFIKKAIAGRFVHQHPRPHGATGNSEPLSLLSRPTGPSDRRLDTCVSGIRQDAARGHVAQRLRPDREDIEKLMDGLARCPSSRPGVPPIELPDRRPRAQVATRYPPVREQLARSSGDWTTAIKELLTQQLIACRQISTSTPSLELMLTTMEGDDDAGAELPATSSLRSRPSAGSSVERPACSTQRRRPARRGPRRREGKSDASDELVGMLGPRQFRQSRSAGLVAGRDVIRVLATQRGPPRQEQDSRRRAVREEV